MSPPPCARSSTSTCGAISTNSCRGISSNSQALCPSVVNRRLRPKQCPNKIQDGVCEFRFINHLVPGFNGHLVGDHDGSGAVVVFDDLHEIALLPELAVGDGALGIWIDMDEVFPGTRHQRFCFHKLANVLNHFLKSKQPAVAANLRIFSHSGTRAEAQAALETFKE